MTENCRLCLFANGSSRDYCHLVLNYEFTLTLATRKYTYELKSIIYDQETLYLRFTKFSCYYTEAEKYTNQQSYFPRLTTSGTMLGEMSEY